MVEKMERLLRLVMFNSNLLAFPLSTDNSVIVIIFNLRKHLVFSRTRIETYTTICLSFRNKNISMI